VLLLGLGLGYPSPKGVGGGEDILLLLELLLRSVSLLLFGTSEVCLDKVITSRSIFRQS
jgi:hypothetical protein